MTFDSLKGFGRWMQVVLFTRANLYLQNQLTWLIQQMSSILSMCILFLSYINNYL